MSQTPTRVAVVTARFNDFITEALHRGALGVLHRQGGLAESQIKSVWVPGAFELPLVAKKLAESGHYQAVIALGCVIRGATTHYDYVCSTTANGLQRVALETGLPVVFGVLTTDTIEQAIERAGTKAGNKGADAAATALEMIQVLEAL